MIYVNFSSSQGSPNLYSVLSLGNLSPFADLKSIFGQWRNGKYIQNS
jgi:hypothetical protein